MAAAGFRDTLLLTRLVKENVALQKELTRSKSDLSLLYSKLIEVTEEKDSLFDKIDAQEKIKIREKQALSIDHLIEVESLKADLQKKDEELRVLQMSRKRLCDSPTSIAKKPKKLSEEIFYHNVKYGHIHDNYLNNREPGIVITEISDIIDIHPLVKEYSRELRYCSKGGCIKAITFTKCTSVGCSKSHVPGYKRITDLYNPEKLLSGHIIYRLVKLYDFYRNTIRFDV